MDNVLVMAGGMIPEDDIPSLEKAGVSRVFGPGTPTYKIIDYITANIG